MLYKLHSGLDGQRARRAWAADFVRAFISNFLSLRRVFQSLPGGTYFYRVAFFYLVALFLPGGIIFATYFCPTLEDHLLYSFFTRLFAAVDVFSFLPFFNVL